MSKLKILFVYKDKEDYEKVKHIKNAKADILFVWKNKLSGKDLKDIDVVVSVGGDGTVLSATHYLFDKPILTVNSSPKKSEGALTSIFLDELEEKIETIIKGNYKIEKLERIEVYINEEIQNPIALNEVFMANEKAYLISKYKIKFKNNGETVEEEQKSSGLIFSTGTGSTAWFKSAGGAPFSPQSRFIKMIVREPYIWKLSKFNLINAVIDEKDEIKVTAETDMMMAIDSIREFKINKGDSVKVKISKWPLLRIV